MRKFPLIIAAVFLVVQISGLTDYAVNYGGMKDWRGGLFALALEAGIFGAAYWLRQNVTRQDGKTDKRDIGARLAAFGGLFLFLLASGYLNTAKSLKDLPEFAEQLDVISAYVFGIVPTLFATVLGVMQGFIDRLPTPPAKAAHDTIPMRVYAIAEKALALVDARLSTAPAQDAHKGKKQCAQCGAWVDNVGSHARWKCPKRKVTKCQQNVTQ
jgi:hypothetical protein